MLTENLRLTTVLADGLRLTTSGTAKLSLALSRVLTRFHQEEETLEPENIDEAVEALVKIVAKVIAAHGSVTMPPPDAKS